MRKKKKKKKMMMMMMMMIRMMSSQKKRLMNLHGWDSVLQLLYWLSLSAKFPSILFSFLGLRRDFCHDCQLTPIFLLSRAQLAKKVDKTKR